GFYFFFFQAEDGIRDYKVTGVQTCALPICFCPAHLSPSLAVKSLLPVRWRHDRWSRGPPSSRSRKDTAKEPRASTSDTGHRPQRSEERRVGKECRTQRERKENKKKN